MNRIGHHTLMSIALAFGLVGLTPRVCEAHNELLHKEITKSAFQSSSGLNTFLADILGADNAPFFLGPALRSYPAPFQSGKTTTPVDWMMEGSYWEDMRVYGGYNMRSVNHFYTLLPKPVKGITDFTERPNTFKADIMAPALGIKVQHVSDSFRWASERGIVGPELATVGAVGANTETWQNARDYEYAALTGASSSGRDDNFAHMLFALGHVLHLNQDLSSPDHVRNDAHIHDSHAYFESYGLKVYLANAKASIAAFNQAFPLRPLGWTAWRAKGFVRLKDFWDRNLYTGNAAALNADAHSSSGQQLGLSEFANGNFLGEDAIYHENLTPNSEDYRLHYFPFPSRKTSVVLGGSAGTSIRKDGALVNRFYLVKGLGADGIAVPHHSVLGFADVITMITPNNIQRRTDPVTPTIEDNTVLQDYHSILLPKAIEYSAGILDYFFRGELETTFTPKMDGTYDLVIKNVSGQDFKYGSFKLFYDDAAGSAPNVPVMILCFHIPTRWRTTRASLRRSSRSKSRPNTRSFTKVSSEALAAAQSIQSMEILQLPQKQLMHRWTGQICSGPQPSSN